MYFQYPLETLARTREATSQLDFAFEARRSLRDSDEVLFEPVHRGLAIFAANECALEQPRRILQDLYGKRVQLQRPKVRYMPGEPLHEPIMHVRIETRREWADVVVRELRRRGTRILEECARGRVAIVRGEAPLAALLGLRAALDAMTCQENACAIRLVRYAPLPPDVGGDAT